MTCLSRMRQNDFDMYQDEYMNKPIEDVWASLIKRGARTHPAYALIAERALYYYFDENFEGSTLECYLVDGNDSQVHVPGEFTSADDPMPCSAFRHPSHKASMSRGTAKHILTKTRRGHFNAEASYPHPLMVKVLGSFAVTNTHGDVIGPHRSENEQNFSAAFLHWLHAMCKDRKICGVLPTRLSLAPLLRKLRPYGDASIKLADSCESKFHTLECHRIEAVTMMIENHASNSSLHALAAAEDETRRGIKRKRESLSLITQEESKKRVNF